MNDKQIDEEYIWNQVFEIVNRYRSQVKRHPLVDYQEPETLSGLLDLDLANSEASWDQLYDWIERYLKYSVHTRHPRFLNRMWAGANLPSIIGEIISAVSNTSAGTYESAPVSTLMEKYMIKEMLDLVGFENGEGQMTTGSSNANLIAMLAARNRAFPAINQSGLFTSKGLYAFVSADSHYSMDKAASVLGIGGDHLIKIQVDGRGRMDTALLDREITRVLNSDGIPFFVGATAGTTVRGAFDPIPDLVTLRARYGFWLHVDGAWGGASIFSDNLRDEYLPAIEKVNSFTMDFHKMVGTSLICNILLFNQSDDGMRQIGNIGDTSYIYGKDENSAEYDLGSLSLQCGRKADALKWFLDWKFYGKNGFAGRVESYLALCQFAENIVKQSDRLELVAPRESFNVCFRYVVPNQANTSANDFNSELRKELHRRRIGMIGSGFVGSILCLRLLVANTRVEENDIKAFFGELEAAGAALLETQ